MKKRGELILHLIIDEIKKGNNPAKISKEHNIKKQTLQYYLRQLKNKGIITKEGYGTWRVQKEVSNSTKASSIKKQIRGHAFNWKVRFKSEIDWERRLKKNNLNFQYIGINNSTPRIIFNNKKIWFTKKGLVIYEPKSFFAENSITSKGLAVFELDKTIKELGRKLKIDLSSYQFTTSREHYGLIKNELAKQYNKKGEKLYIRDDQGIWMWIDDSHSLAELENNEMITNKKVQDWYNDHKKHNFEVTPSFLLNSINKVTENQMMFNENFESHVEAIQTLSKTVNELREEIKTLRNLRLKS